MWADISRDPQASWGIGAHQTLSGSAYYCLCNLYSCFICLCSVYLSDHVYVCRRGLWTWGGHFPQSLSTFLFYFWVVISEWMWGLLIGLEWLESKLLDSSCAYLLRVGIIDRLFLLECWGHELRDPYLKIKHCINKTLSPDLLTPLKLSWRSS